MHNRNTLIDTLILRWRYLPRLIGLLWSVSTRDVLVITMLSAATGLIPLLVVAILRGLVDSAITALGNPTILPVALGWCAALFGANLLQQAMNSANRGLGQNIQERLKARVQQQLLETAAGLPLAAFEQPIFYDQLQRAQRGLDTRLLTTIQQLVPLPAFIVTITSLLLYLGTAHILIPVILLVGMLPIVLFNAHYLDRQYVLERSQTHPERKLRYLETLMVTRPAAAEIRLFGLSSYLLENWQQRFVQHQHERIGLARNNTAWLIIRTAVERILFGVSICGLVLLILLGRVSIGAFASFISATDQFTGALYNLVWSLTNTDADLRYIRDLLDYLALRKNSAATSHLVPGALPDTGLPTIRFEDVTFRYPESEQPVLNNITLTMRPGERIALVGENGAGKSTLAKLLLGLYQPTEGRILVDGQPLQALIPVQWHKRAVAVFQEYMRYEVTLRENIGFGALERMHDDGALALAAHKSGADIVVQQLPAGYGTIVGKAYDASGQDLSGGQWQKLALARAYLRDAQVLVLDEPAAALDPRAEVEVYRQFRDAAQSRSVLLISHRLGSARLADRIIVLDKGQIVEEGSHAELLARGGQYARLFSIQAAWYQ